MFVYVPILYLYASATELVRKAHNNIIPTPLQPLVYTLHAITYTFHVYLLLQRKEE